MPGKKIRVSDETHAVIVGLAKQGHRSIKNQADMMIRSLATVSVPEDGKETIIGGVIVERLGNKTTVEEVIEIEKRQEGE